MPCPRAHPTHGISSASLAAAAAISDITTPGRTTGRAAATDAAYLRLTVFAALSAYSMQRGCRQKVEGAQNIFMS